jgi:hypothetical protein
MAEMSWTWRTWAYSTAAFYVIFAITFFGLDSTPGSQEGFILSR